MRATDGLQTTITLGPVNGVGQTISLELSLGMSLPMPNQDERLPCRATLKLTPPVTLKLTPLLYA